MRLILCVKFGSVLLILKSSIQGSEIKLEAVTCLLFVCFHLHSVAQEKGDIYHASLGLNLESSVWSADTK